MTKIGTFVLSIVVSAPVLAGSMVSRTLLNHNTPAGVAAIGAVQALGKISEYPAAQKWLEAKPDVISVETARRKVSGHSSNEDVTFVFKGVSSSGFMFITQYQLTIVEQKRCVNDPPADADPCEKSYQVNFHREDPDAPPAPSR